MFSEAYEIASNYTAPVIISTRTIDGLVNCELGAFVVLNEDGWIVTVAHVWNSFHKWNHDQNEIKSYNQKVDSIHNNGSLKANTKKNRISKIKKDKTWLTHHSFWWGKDGRTVVDVIPLPEADLVVGRLEPFDSKEIKNYPVLINPKSIKPGTSLCKLGYPFYNITATFDDQSSAFRLAPNALPLPRFPIEGIFTRNVVEGKSKDGKYVIKSIETSSPGLRGQSGGPIFDKDGNLWAIQSRTAHLDLGFSAKIMKNGRTLEENQVLNTGIGIHPELITKFLEDNGIKFQMLE